MGKNLREKRIGETRQMNCGMMATIIEYRNNSDIDIQFEDGTIVEHRAVSNFNKGTIAHPEYNAEKIQRKNKYLNMSNLMNCGITATIIEYRNNSDIDVQFEDGLIVKHKSVSSFENGSICHPNYSKKDVAKNKYLHMTKLMNCGMMATIIEYRNYDDIDVQFKDGTIVKHRTTYSFAKGEIGYPNNKRM